MNVNIVPGSTQGAADFSTRADSRVIVFPAGRTSDTVIFAVTPVDDMLIDWNEAIEFRASYGSLSATAELPIIDNDLPYVLWETILTAGVGSATNASLSGYATHEYDFGSLADNTIELPGLTYTVTDLYVSRDTSGGGDHKTTFRYTAEGYATHAGTYNLCIEGTPHEIDKFGESVQDTYSVPFSPIPLGYTNTQVLHVKMIKGDSCPLDDLDVTAHFPAFTTSIDEGAQGAYEITLTASLVGTLSSSTVEVTFSLGGTATLGTDYTRESSDALKCTIPIGETSCPENFSIRVIDDEEGERTETIEITAKHTSAGTDEELEATAQVAILDNDRSCIAEPITLGEFTDVLDESCESTFRDRPGVYARNYSFTLTQPETVVFRMSSQDPDIDPFLYLLHGSDYERAYFVPNAYNDDFAEGHEDARVIADLEAGDYIAHATTFHAGEMGDFSLLYMLYPGAGNLPGPIGPEVYVPLPPPADEPAPDADRVPVNVALSSEGLLTWDPDPDTPADDDTTYLVRWVAAPTAPAGLRTRSATDLGRSMVDESDCEDGCQFQIEEFDAERHYLVHVNTMTRAVRGLPPVVVRHPLTTPEEADGFVENAALSAEGLLTWEPDADAEGDDDVTYSIRWVAAPTAPDSIRSRSGTDFGRGTVDGSDCEDGCEFQIEGFDAERHYLADLNTVERAAAGLPPVAVRHTPGDTGTPPAHDPSEGVQLTGLTVSPVPGNPTALDVTWNPVAGATQYRLSGIAHNEVRTTGTSHRYERRKPGTTYTVKVEAWDLDNRPEKKIAEAEASGTTGGQLRMSLHTAFEGSSSHQMRLSWAPVSSAKMYLLTWKGLTEGSERFRDVSPLPTSFLVTGLIPDAEYTFEIYAFRTRVGGKIGQGSTRRSTESLVADVTVRPDPADPTRRLKVEWAHPGNSGITSYVILNRFIHKRAPEELSGKKLIQARDFTGSTSLGDLLPNVEVQIQIRAQYRTQNRAVERLYATVTGRTDERPVPGLAAYSRSNSSVRVRWTEMNTANDVTRDEAERAVYHVEYKRTSESAWTLAETVEGLRWPDWDTTPEYSADITELDQGVLYDIRVRAEMYNDRSIQFGAATTQGRTFHHAAPPVLSPVSTDHTRLKVDVPNNAHGILGYRYEWRLASDSDFSNRLGQTEVFNDNAYFITGLNEATGYIVRAAAIYETDDGERGYGDWAQASATTSGMPAPPAHTITAWTNANQKWSQPYHVIWDESWGTYWGPNDSGPITLDDIPEVVNDPKLTLYPLTTAQKDGWDGYRKEIASNGDLLLYDETSTGGNTGPPPDREPTFGGQTVPDKSYTQNSAVDDTLPEASGGDGALTYSITETLPAGLTFTASMRKITGTPTGTQAATYYTYVVSDADGDQAAILFAITIAEDLTPSFGDQTVTAKSYIQNSAVDNTLPQATGGDGTLTYAIVETLPAGLSFSSSTRKITGTPTTAQAAGTYTYRVTDADGDTADLTFTIAIAEDLTPSFGNGTITAKSYTQNTAVDDTLLQATGGDGALTYSIVGTLPAGLQFSSSTRKITGTPTRTQAAANYTYRVTDADGDTADLSFTIAVSEEDGATGTSEPNVAFVVYEPATGDADASARLTEGNKLITDAGLTYRSVAHGETDEEAGPPEDTARLPRWYRVDGETHNDRTWGGLRWLKAALDE